MMILIVMIIIMSMILPTELEKPIFQANSRTPEHLKASFHPAEGPTGFPDTYLPIELENARTTPEHLKALFHPT